MVKYADKLMTSLEKGEKDIRYEENVYVVFC